MGSANPKMEVLTEAEAAAILKCSVQQLRRLGIPCTFLQPRKRRGVRYWPAHVQAFLEKAALQCPSFKEPPAETGSMNLRSKARPIKGQPAPQIVAKPKRLSGKQRKKLAQELAALELGTR